MIETPLAPQALAHEAALALRPLLAGAVPDVLLVPGSGWGAAAASVGVVVGSVPAETIPGFHASPVAGHHSEISLLELAHEDGEPLRALALPRTHFYEGLGTAAVAHPVRVAAALGIHRAILTNGCGSANPAIPAGSVALIRDHLNLTASTPLEGATFVDLTDAYSPALRALVLGVDPSIPEAVYAQFPGPQYETPAEVRMAVVLGADLVGMSTALETIAAREAGVEVLALSLITNAAAGTTPGEALSHTEVLEAGASSKESLASLVERIVRVWPRD
ncbi:purine-nucleoside phosphorylase [Actinomyces culturomici]|uniref:purine-nucleoside phosphorylase n=1 Tax=Actinomyces culturomici TaxID=1926276 RepID=UPI000E20B8CE|nr:purine-nucleoside phosphorylase [Actinomyces culturomici]